MYQLSDCLPETKTSNKLTKEQAIILTGFTGVTCCNFSDFHEDVERRLGQPVWTHQFGNKEFAKLVNNLYRQDFLEMLPE